MACIPYELVLHFNSAEQPLCLASSDCSGRCRPQRLQLEL
jgi:hypothetical protein